VNLDANRRVLKIYLMSATVLSADNGVCHFSPQLIAITSFNGRFALLPTRSRNQRPKRTLTPVLGLEADRVTLMRLITAEVTDGTREARTFCKVAGGVPVSFHPVLFQSKIDHRAQKQCGRERMFACELAVELLRAP
jgi:hypothetical protein